MAYVFIGTSSFDTKIIGPDFYPSSIKRDQLIRFYAQKLNTVEINSTFYANPKDTSIQQWKDNVPASFRYTFKAPRHITHNEGLKFDIDQVISFLKSLNGFGSIPPHHLILFQIPASTYRNINRLSELLELLPGTFHYAFEFRNRSWVSDIVYKVLQDFNTAFVLIDSPRKADGTKLWPRVNIETSNTVFYIRLHGAKELYTSNYEPEDLKVYEEFIRKKAARGLDTFCYFNNSKQFHGVENALELQEYLADLAPKSKPVIEKELSIFD